MAQPLDPPSPEPLNAIHEVRADGRRRLVAAAWQIEPKAWKHFTDLLQERRL
ncbi:hypothetical protein [Glycomyces niveus]|uniref:DUF397 domain-containing protein n=1 Tax=Glycomyces niveus TaxID=2820287 RepID=A0ABS3U4W1_9ACTN|nr:hypothetical protein [Glycomyces sp. NEAU-S30]MBO3733819.1 hypothetical protein [Glycomyces sp. NEAU-S30]